MKNSWAMDFGNAEEMEFGYRATQEFNRQTAKAIGDLIYP